MSPASPHPAPPRCFLGGDKAQGVVSTLIRACTSLHLPLNRGEEVLGGDSVIFFKLLDLESSHTPFPPGVEKCPLRLAKEEHLSLGSSSLRPPPPPCVR